jgi:nucleoside-diphosphate-sugar epimerase
MPKADKVLITGASGFVGSNLARRLLREGCEVHILSRPLSPQWRLKDILPKLNNHTIDLLELQKLKELIRTIKPEIIFHLAALGVFNGISPSEKKLFENNFLGTVNLIRACNEIEYKCFINTGSSSEYGPKEKPMKETDICEPMNAYGISKLAALLYGSFIAKTENRPIIGLRLFSPFGYFDDIQRLIPSVIISALQNKDILLSNPQGVRDFIFIEDVVEAYLKFINEAEQFKGEIFNLGSGEETSAQNAAETICGLTNTESNLKKGVVSPRPWDTAHWQADISKIKRCLHWKPGHSFEEGLEKTIQWYKNNLSLYKNEN